MVVSLTGTRGRVAKGPGLLVSLGCWSGTGLRGGADTGVLASQQRPSITLPGAAGAELSACQPDVLPGSGHTGGGENALLYGPHVPSW